MLSKYAECKWYISAYKYTHTHAQSCINYFTTIAAINENTVTLKHSVKVTNPSK